LGQIGAFGPRPDKAFPLRQADVLDLVHGQDILIHTWCQRRTPTFTR
jgi:hypothetical protein